MARQYLQDGPYIDPPVTSPLSADTATTALAMWSGAQFTPLFANDAKAGKIYVVEAGGLITTAATGALTIAPGSAPVAGHDARQRRSRRPFRRRRCRGRGICAASGLSGRSVLRARTRRSSAKGSVPVGRRRGDREHGLDVTFGGTSCAFDATVNNFFTFQKTLSVAGSFTTHWCYIYAIN
jgi:hypothetical protein